ncbi:Hypothetical protein HDN1F_24150 [gamma proteobacterium HdN1]|nr:Hypothetical protein HDN1F_24150 [gamma proteobacterium HdN1]
MADLKKKTKKMRSQPARSARLVQLGVFLSLAAPMAAQAALTENLTIGNAKALALGNAVTADPPGIDSVHFNPAGLEQMKGRQTELKLVSGAFSIELGFGDYIPERKKFMEDTMAKGVFTPQYFDNEAHLSKSKTEGASIMVPITGMVDLPVLFAPIGGVSYQPPESRMTFATNVYSPLMVGFYRADNDPGRFIGQRLSFTVFTYFSPSVSFKVNDQLTLGGTITFNYAGVGLDLPFRGGHEGLPFLWDLQEQACNPNYGKPEVPDSIGSGDGGWAAFVPCEPDRNKRLQFNELLGTLQFEVTQPLTFGVNVGALYKPQPWITFGAVYQSRVNMDMEGDFKWTNSDPWMNFLWPLLHDIGKIPGEGPVQLPNGIGKRVVSGTAKLDMKLPEHYAFGTSIQLTPKYKVNLDYKFTGWSAWKAIPVQFSEPIDFLRLAEYIQPGDATKSDRLVFPLGLEDTWNWAVGMEYQWNDRLALRLGLEDRPSSIPKKYRTPLLPMGSGKLYGAGFEYVMKDNSVMNFSIGYFASSIDMPGGTSRLGNSMDQRLVIYNPFQGTDIKADLSSYLVEYSYRQQF